MTQDDIVNQVVQDVPEAPLMTIREAVIRMARELCTEADAWVQDGEPVVVAANTDYPEVEASRGEPLRIISLTINGRECGNGEGYRQTSPKTVILDRKPSASVIYGRLACRPIRGDMPPSSVVSRWADVIADGARWRLLALPQPWKDMDLALYHQRLWQSGVNDAKRLARYGHQTGGARVRSRRFL